MSIWILNRVICNHLKVNNMKIRLFSAIALAMSGLLAGGCTVEELASPEGTIRAVMEGEQAKTSVTDAGSFTWSTGDQVWLQTTNGSVVGTLSSGAGTAVASFSHGPFVGELTGKAVYPYILTNEGMNFSGKLGSANTIWYPAAGVRHLSGGGLVNVGRDGYYWSASGYGYRAYCLYFRNDGYVAPLNKFERAYGVSVRCLQVVD